VINVIKSLLKKPELIIFLSSDDYVSIFASLKMLDFQLFPTGGFKLPPKSGLLKGHKFH